MSQKNQESAENIINLVIEGLSSDDKKDKHRVLEFVLREFVEEDDKFKRLKEVVQWDEEQFMSSKKWIVYLLRCSDNSLYTGITTDVERRLQEHKSGEGAKYTKSRRPVNLVYKEKVGSRSEATKREIEIKNFSKTKKEQLVES